jgi:alanine dehydrogenase
MPVIGLVTEIKNGERRVALDPHACAAAVDAGNRVLVESGAGVGAGFSDAEYKEAGAELVTDADEVWGADIVVKVKEPQQSEYRHFRPGLTLFCYLHLAAEPGLAKALATAGVTALAYETVTEGGHLPLLAPMSEIAGRTAAIVAAHYLSTPEGGSGTLVGGAAGVPPSRALVIGLGVAGTMAARGLMGLDAEVIGVDVNLDRLRDAQLQGTVAGTLASSPHSIEVAASRADVVIGAALVPGARAPQVMTAEHVASMRPGSVVVDLAIDQGGCIETARPTTLSDPVYRERDVVHYCVTNVPGQYPRTSSRALSAAVTPRLLALARDPEHRSLEGALNVAGGRISHPAVAEALGWEEPDRA